MSWNPLKRARSVPTSPPPRASDTVTAKPAGDAFPVIPGYELLDKIARGGMATVYRARHRRTGQVVAVKILSPEMGASEVVRRRFEQEFKAARRLDHPHIVRTLDHGVAEAGPYLVMEFVEGETLGERLGRDGPLPQAEAVRLIIQVARALDHAHGLGLIHRDVKPDNILITADGQARLTDFGLVKQLAEEAELTRPGQGLGTLNFVAPEQLQNARGIDRRCDVYSLGATLYMAVTGACPFAARTHSQVIKKKVANELTLPRQLVAGLSEQLDRAIRRAMHPDRGQRPMTCAEFCYELTARGGIPPAEHAGAAAPAKPPRPAAAPALSTASMFRNPLTVPDVVAPPEPAGVWLWRVVGSVAAGVCLGIVIALYRWHFLRP